MTEPVEELRTLASTIPTDRAPLATYIEKVRERAYTVTDDDVAELTRAGLSEDEIFEATVAVAASEGLRRLDVARRVLG